GKALLETQEIVFRSPTARLRIPLAGAKVRADGAALAVTFGKDRAEITFAAAAEAEKWARAIQNPKPRIDKLGVAPGQKVAVVGGIDDADFLAELAGRAPPVKLGPGMDIIFYAVPARAALAKLASLREKLAPAGAIWTVRPKGSPAIAEADVLAGARDAGLVDVKVVAFSPTHTAEKLVIPVADRPVKKR